MYKLTAEVWFDNEDDAMDAKSKINTTLTFSGRVASAVVVEPVLTGGSADG